MDIEDIRLGDTLKTVFGGRGRVIVIHRGPTSEWIELQHSDGTSACYRSLELQGISEADPYANLHLQGDDQCWNCRRTLMVKTTESKLHSSSGYECKHCGAYPSKAKIQRAADVVCDLVAQGVLP